jgi:formate dehydrogenase assembly factor FdhD
MIRLGKSVAIEKINAVNREILKDTIPVELVLTIILNNRPVASISCLPDNLIELAIGYLLNNGYVKKYSDIILLRLCEKELKLNKILSQTSGLTPGLILKPVLNLTVRG